MKRETDIRAFLDGLRQRHEARCSDLRASGIDPDQDAREAEDAANQARRRERYSALIQAASLPPIHARMSSWGEYRIGCEHQARTRDDLDARVRGRDGGIYAILGDRGIGKTQMAVLLCTVCCWHAGRSARYSRAMDFFLDVRSAFARNSEKSQQEIVRRYIEPGMLVIDEAHERKNSPAEGRDLTYVIDHRYAAGDRLTLLISNESEPQFRESMGDSISRRIDDSGMVIVCAGWPRVSGPPSR